MKSNRLMVVTALLVVLFSLVSCNKNTIDKETTSIDVLPPTQPTIKDYSSDALLAVAEIENTHPSFLLGDLPDNYSDIRNEYLAHTSELITHTDFLLSTQKYLTSLSDGHMGGGLLVNGLFIDVNWVSVNSLIYLLNENGTLSDTQVIEIGGISTEKVMNQVDMYYYAENDAARERQYSVYCRQEEMLSLAGCQYNDNSVVLTLQSGGVTSAIECKLINSSLLSEYYGDIPNYIIKHQMIDDVFYIDLRTFQNDKSVDNTASAIRDAIKNGISKFIIDIRDNNGGSSLVGEKLLDAMGMSVPSYGCYIRFSRLSEKQRGAANGEELIYYAPATNRAHSNDNISLIVLTNNITFSAATMLGVWVQDGKLGSVVGQPSSNSPTSYGDMLSIRLPISGIDLRISYKKFLRPDSEADSTTLHPDILVDFNEDALEIALSYLSQK